MIQEENVKDKKKECLYVPEKRQVYHALIKAWQDYYNLSKKQVPDKKITSRYKRVIHNLQDKLRIAPTPFIVYEAFGLYLYKLNPELFKEDVTHTLVEKGIIKTIAVMESRMGLDKGPNMVEEIIRRDIAMYKYLAEITSRTKGKDNPSNANNQAAISNPVNTRS